MANEEKLEEKVEGEKKVEQKEQPAQKVELDRETYSALLDRIAELEAESTRPRRKEEETSDIDTLAEEGRRRPQAREVKEEPTNLDEYTPSQLAQFIIDRVNDQGGQRLQKIEVAVETMRVLREIDKAEAKYPDFYNYEEKIRELAMETPSLSIEKAYKLAKLDEAEKKPKEGEEEHRPATRTERLLKLPPRTFGEKPGAAVGATKESSQTNTLKEAATRAWNETVGEGKTNI